MMIVVATTRRNQRKKTCRFGKLYSIWMSIVHVYILCFMVYPYNLSHSSCTNLFDRTKSDREREKQIGKKCKRAQILSLLFYDAFRIWLFIHKISMLWHLCLLAAKYIVQFHLHSTSFQPQIASNH